MAAEFADLLNLPTAQGYRAGPTEAVTVSGAGVEGRAALSVVPGRLNFAPHTLHLAGDPLMVTVRNVGNEPVRVTTSLTSPAPDFAVQGISCTETLDPGEECRLPVTFAPRGMGQRQGSLAVTGDAIGADVPDPAPATVDLVGTTIQPTLVANPTLLRPARVTMAEGRNFPPDVTVALTWSKGIGRTEVKPDEKGTFSAPVLVFRRDILGTRQLVATIPGVGAVRSQPVLVVPLTGQPPNFVSRS